MVRFLLNTMFNALGLWVVTLLIPAVKLAPYGGDSFWTRVGSFLVVAAIFGLVHAVIGPIIKVLSAPLYILTFGLIHLVINGALLLFVAWLSQLIGSPIFSIDGFNSEGLAISSLGWAILASVILYIVSYIGRTIFKKAYGR
ncbi:MAG: phage holin family protein [Rhodoluna sp.]|nr:phage holin family protein [Rhodoluna sp.]MBP6186825.1 phage holin family protein [Rhodoluna sp.]